MDTLGGDKAAQITALINCICVVLVNTVQNLTNKSLNLLCAVDFVKLFWEKKVKFGERSRS
jgi:hypothetical protein